MEAELGLILNFSEVTGKEVNVEVCGLVLFKTAPKLHNCSLVLDLMLSKASGIATWDQLSPVFIMSLTCKAKNAGGCKSWKGQKLFVLKRRAGSDL